MRLLKTKNLLILAFLCLNLTSCTFMNNSSIVKNIKAAHQLSSADEQLTDLYEKKLTMQRKSAFEKLNIMTSFDSLATDSAKAAENKDREYKTRLGFYRNALTSAWQAKNWQSINVFKGNAEKLCNEDAGFDKAPRDCWMIRVIPNLAGLDEENEDVTKMVHASAQVDIEEANKLFGKFVFNMNAIIASLPGIDKSSANEALGEHVKLNAWKALCGQMTTLVSTLFPKSSEKNQAVCAIQDYYKELKSMKLRSDPPIGCSTRVLPDPQNAGCN